MNNKPRQTLCEIIRDYGRDVARDPKRCKALLNDLCGGEHKREINVLVSAMDERVSVDLLEPIPNVSCSIVLPRLAKRLYDNKGITTEFAQWAVESWALALGVIQEHDLADVRKKREARKRLLLWFKRVVAVAVVFIVLGVSWMLFTYWDQDLGSLFSTSETESSFIAGPDNVTESHAGGDSYRKLEGHTGKVLSVTCSGDGKYIASGSEDNNVMIWDAQNGTLLHTLTGHTKRIGSVSWSPDSKFLASGADDYTIRVWDTRDGTLYRTFDENGFVNSVSWSPDGERIASGSRSGSVKVWSVQDDTLLQKFSGHRSSVWSITWSPDGTRIASGAHYVKTTDITKITDKTEYTIWLWNVQNGKVDLIVEEYANWILSVAWSPDGKRLATGSDDNTVRVWDAQKGTLLHTLTGHTGKVWSVAWSQDGKRLASGSEDSTVRIWNPQRGTLLETFTAHTGDVFSVAWSGNLLASASSDKTIRLWQVSE
jgi:WD40 repeat protein